MIWVIIFAVVLVAGLWTAALLLTWPLWIPAAVSVLAVVGVSVFLVVRHLRSKQRAAELEAELRKQSKAPMDRSGAGPTEAELEIQGRIRELAASLRRGQFKNRWSDAALHTTPWYLVLGPPNSGKSTSLQTSGLGLRAAGGRQPKSKAVVATKGCQPWVCDGGVLIDTAGRYALGDGEDDEWGTLLTTLRRTRRQKPLDGVVLCYALSDLISDRPEQLEEKAKRLRACLEDLCAKLGSVLPVYLVLTKADLVPGFSEFYSDVVSDAGERVWGATLETKRGDAQDSAEAVKTEFDVMKQAMHAYFLARLPSQQRPPEATSKALRFPVEFENIRAPLARLVEEVFRPSSYQETPLLRGFYFTSSGASGGGFEAAPAAFKMAGTQFAVNTNYSSAPAASRSLFLGQLFPRIVFPDRHFATRSRRSVALERQQQLLIGLGALALFIFGILPPTLSCISNFNLIDDSRDDARRARQLAASQGVTGVVSEALDLLVERYLSLTAETERFSLQHFWGPYTAAPLRDALRLRYLDQLRAIVHGPLHDRVSDSIRVAADQRGLDPTSFEGAYRDLQLYLMLAHPDHLDPQFATSELAKSWLHASGRQLGGNAPAVDSHVQSYVQILSQDPTWAWAEDAGLVARARAQLSQMPVEDIKYSVLEQAAANAPPILPEHIFVGEAARYVTTRGKVEVPGLYTALGWQKVKPYLKPDQASEFAPWVLAEQGGNAPAWGVEALRKLYFDRYARAWMDFLVGLDINTPTDLNSAIEELSALNKGEGPYVRLFRRLSENVRLELEPVSLKDQVLAKVDQKVDQASAAATGAAPPPPPPERRVSPVEQSFRRMVRFGFGDAPPVPGGELPPSGLGQYLDQLRTLEVSLRQLQDSAIEATNEFGNEMSKAASNIERLLAGFDQTERLALEPLLLNPIRGSQKIVEAKGRQALTDRWRVEVYEPYRRLATRYPFVLSSGSDVALPDFAEFFRPQSGTFWRYYEENLSTRFLHSGVRYVPKPSDTKTGFRSDFLECLSQAQQIGEAVFVDGAQQPAVPFKVKMQSSDARVSETILKVDGETIVYRNEPEKWRAMLWPGKDGPPGASLQVKGVDFEALVRREDGDFGFLRLLSAGDIKPTSAGSLTLEASWRFSLKGAESRVTIQFQASRQRHPFQTGFFSKLDCPPAITAAPDR